MKHSRIAVIQGHNKDTKTDQLYEPLRKTLLQDTSGRKNSFQNASLVSHVTHYVKTHTYSQNIQLGEHTFIPEDVKLKPTHDIWKIPKDHTYYIINVQSKTLPPISPQQLEAKLKHVEQQIIVYDYQDSDFKVQIDHRNITGINQAESKLIYDYRLPTYTPRTDKIKSQLRQTYVTAAANSSMYNSPNFQNKYVVVANNINSEIKQQAPQKIDRDSNSPYKVNLIKNLNKTQQNPTQINNRYISKIKDKNNQQVNQKNTKNIQINDKLSSQREQKITLLSERKNDNEQTARSVPLRKRAMSGIKLTQPKYNLFSLIDQPVNNLVRGNACTCPANQIIAESRNQISWYGSLKQ